MKITSNGIGIHVEEQGSGALALIFLHYWGGSTRTWKYVAAPLAKSYRIIATDHRGWGESDAPPTGYALADHADDVLGVISALGIRRYIVIGHSMGGKIAQYFASRRPPGLVGLVLLGSALPAPLEFPPEMLEAVVNAYATREAVEATIDQLLIAKPLDPKDREQVIADSLRGAAHAREAWVRQTGQEDITDLVAVIQVPTLALYGEFDRVHSAESAQSSLIPLIPGAVLEILPGTGCLSPLESPAELVRLIDKFAAGLA